ncbi:hypothetical protein TCAL_10091 [Tigriopus californicus]|uniref:MBD domain-containing protein n=1 Tax=Tigriopus californicus TaxID=6832 RepID=A0A553P9U1_TIGCA|nr:hypothetical protein TCAL_10091 [Tigriopus californicus]|eukprot:TCALIF_10091-PA protein Name:"Similar to Mecp2 Methyl-CpG-binding protein 2 (Rattus norvegicus)" AED:0.00 eAED:0.00 QI:382/1/1/1/0.57/0.62/8/264/1800
MDDAFNLEDISDEQTLERLESLFESASSFPSLDSPHFGEDGHIGVTFSDAGLPGSGSANNAGSTNNLLGSLDPNPGDGLFGQTSQSNANNIFGNTSSTESNIASVFSAQSSFVANQTQVVNSLGTNTLESKQSQATHTSKSTNQTLTSTLSIPTQPQTQLVYASKSVAPTMSGHLPTSTPTVISSISGQQPGLILNTLTSQSPASVQSIFQGGVVQSGGHPMLQIQLPQLQQQQQQPQQQGKLTSIASLIQGASQTVKTVQAPSPSNGQPQLLPKMTSSQAKLQPGNKGTMMTMSTAMTATTVTGTTPLILNNGHMLTSMTQGQTSGPLLLNSLGQVVGSAGQAGSPILFQQQTGSPFIMLRQSAPTLQTTPTIIQTAGGQTGTILLQQPGSAGMINAQPQVKLITPQGRMQMQQIQTPSGPKLIAVPVGQATLMPQLHTGLTTGQHFTALSSAQILASGGTPTIVSTLPGGTTVSSSYLTTPTTIVSLGSTKVSQPQFVSTLSSSSIVSGSTTMSQAVSNVNTSQPQKKKKSKKKKKESQNSSSSSGDKKQGLDLGELMKDVGLDLDNFGMEEGAHPTPISFDTSSITLPTIAQTAGTLQASTLSMMTSDTTTGLPVSGSQLLAQIQQPLPMQTANTNQLQLVQGPNGQFVLQSTAQPTTAYITQQSLGDSSSLHATAIIAGTSQTVTLPNQTLAQALTASPMTSAVAPTPRTPSRRVNTDPNRVPLYEDDRLPPGWHRKVSQRKSGSSAGRYEVFIIGPTGKRFRSKNELKTFFEKTGERSLNPEDFDFSTFGTGRTTFVTTPSIQTKANPVSAPSVVGSTPTSTVLASKPSTVPQPIVSSRPSVSSHPQSQVSLPQTQVMTPTILQPQPSISNPPLSSEGLPNLLQSITQPLPPKSLQIPPPHTQPVVVSSAPSGPVTPLYQSQISMETADADAQISQLIETLQKDPQHLTIESDKMADFLKSFQQEAETPTSGPPNIASLLDQGNPSTSTPPSSSMSPPILKPSAKLMPSSSASTDDKGQCSSDDGSKPERTTGTTGFQASFLNSLANRRVSSDEDSSSSSPATPQQKQQQLPPPSLTPVSTQFNSLAAPVTSVTSITSPLEPPKVLSQMSRGEMVPATLPPTSVPITVNPSITMGGASTQMRAVQSLPPNTRLVRGPNGQYTLQKVQTIELSPEMQQSLKLVQNKIQEIDQKPTKSPLDEAELAQLQTKQQQILATGRPIIAGVQPPTPGGQGNLVPSRLSNPVSVHQQPPVVPTPKIPVPSVSLPSTIGLPASNMGGSAGKPQVPHLTDQQKRIVAEFKQKMGLLPQEQQASFIAQHKSDLIKQLNFDPSQIQLLKGTSTLQQRVPIPSGVVPNPSLPAAKVILPGSNSLPVVQGGGVSTPIVLQQVVPTEKEAVPVVGLKRPSSGLDGGGPPVKHKKTAWVESQVRKDQNEALNANYNVNFKSTEDACKRLLRYHVFGELDPNPMEEEQAQVAFENKAEDLISKYQTMMDKYHYLLIQESMREASSSEDVMLSRLWDSDERLALAKEKEEVKSGKLLPLPPLPESWSSRYEELYGQKPPAEGLHPGKILELEESLKPKRDEEPLASEPVVAPSAEPIKVNHTPTISNGTETVIDNDDDEEEKDEDGKFVGLKISRSQSGSWSKQKHPSGGSSGSRRHLSGEDPLEASMRKLHQTQNPLPVTTASEDDGSSSDEEFSLKDIDASQAVGSILAEDHHEEFDLGFGRYDTPTMSGEGDADSVQNAINSILDLPQGERMETPDLSNITGLLDSMEEEGEHAGQDAVTEAAVNSIPRF